ncbi:hypothetical protein EG328_003691 [Venturia inaequalis]|uniref:Uncharacterized protein n=1 Tax=Venturia inaequalis TaxID=5025 RepID=A0A8H3UTY3_VENIN|nr:hypothetical protein EG328_003691 [Venturia inaequalis]KAE9994216.1 hypothetical protein EG327_000498 [Venturia inaequalis]
MKLTSTLLLCLAVNSLAADAVDWPWTCYQRKGTTGVCRQAKANIPGSGDLPQACLQVSQCEKPEHACTPDQFIDPGTGYKYATCGE